MSNEITVLRQEQLFVNVVGKRITAFPSTGAIMSVEKVTPDSSMLSGLHKTAVFIVNGDDTYRVTLNVMPMSSDDAWLHAVAEAIRRTGQPAPLTVSYAGVNYVSASCVIEQRPARNFSDTAEAAVWPLIGLFTVAQVVSFVNPKGLEASDIIV